MPKRKTGPCVDCGADHHPGPHINCEECGDYSDGISSCGCGAAPIAVASIRAAAGGYHVVPNHILYVRYSASGKSRIGYRCALCGRRERAKGDYQYRHCRRDLYAEPFGMQKTLLEMRAR